MSDMDLLEAARPDVAPLTDDERQWLRSQVFEESPTAPAAGPTETAYRATPVVLSAGGQERTQGSWPARALTIAAAVIALVGLSGLWMAARPDGAEDEPAASAPPASTSLVPAAAPLWYQPIRSVLPDGFDQIVLTDASAQSLSFKAFRTGTRQLLEMSIGWPGTEGRKNTSEVVTFTDTRGDYYESTSAVTLITNDQRIVSVRCGLSPIGGGAVGSASMADSRRDYCGPGFDNLGLDPASRRDLTVRFAGAFPSESSIAGFAQPTPPPSESPALLQQLTEFLGVPVEIGGEQAFGVLRNVNLSNPTSARDTEFTVIHGIWPPQVADGANTGAAGSSRFFHYDDVAVALVVTADGTGYHLLTTNLADDHLARLGSLLDLLAASDEQPAGPIGVPDTSPASIVPTSTISVGEGSALAIAMQIDGTVLVVNASGTDGLAASFARALGDNGFTTVDPTNAVDGVINTQSAIYFHDDAPIATYNALSMMDAVPIPFGENLHGQAIPGLTDAMLDSADVIVVLGTDLVSAPWEAASPPLVRQGIGELLVVDASTTPAGSESVAQQVEQLRDDGVAIAGVLPATREVEEAMLMPIEGSTPWTFAVAELTGIDGFDTWTPSLISEPVPPGVRAVLILTDQ
ncbi:MAG: hypothetical protein F2534_19675 [Actinobacteria bacterium]|uniref:Unannotated protein n=1 Tax=freshwater metagenome TaxID=449393 RepID=A0A6J6FZ87_9ZZZZ|nr:hypothetical protein [Actinomycetota bacterium]